MYVAPMPRAFVSASLPAFAWMLLIPATAPAEDLRVGTSMGYSHALVTLRTVVPEGDLEFAPETRPRPGFEVNYGKFGFSLAAPLAGGDWMRPEFSAAKGFSDFSSHYYGNAWGLEAYHHYTRGFYAQAGAASGRVFHPSMTMRASGITLYHALDPDSRVYHLNEGLVATGGNIDFFVALGASNTRVRDAIPLAEEYAYRESTFHDVRSMDVTSLSAGGGLAITSNLAGLYFDQALFAGYGPQFRVWDDRSDVAWNLVKVNLRAKLGIRSRWFDVGGGFENDAHAAMAGKERAMFHSLVAKAGVELFL
jgi:hypothetical protein